jgi:hypothetical protein
MTDRPPVKLGERLPEGSLNGLEALLPRFTGDDPGDAYVIGRLVRRKTEYDDDTEVTTAHVRFAEIEILPDGELAAKTLTELRSERTGQMEFGTGPDPDWDELARLRQALGNWQAAEGLSGVDLGARWADVMGGTDGVDTTVVSRLREFLLTVGAVDDGRRRGDTDG